MSCPAKSRVHVSWHLLVLCDPEVGVDDRKEHRIMEGRPTQSKLSGLDGSPRWPIFTGDGVAMVEPTQVEA